MKFLFVSQFEPKSEGHGGNHRAYQIYYDLCDAAGQDQVAKLTWQGWREQNPQPSGNKTSPTAPDRKGVLGRIQNRLRLRERFNRARHIEPEQETLARLLRSTRISQLYSDHAFVENYRQILEKTRPRAVFFEHAGFRDLVFMNCLQGIESVACIQNIESFDVAAPVDIGKKALLANMGVQFGAEVEFLGACEKRFFISRLETALSVGLGLGSAYYPYMPVGLLREHFLDVRRQRENVSQTEKLFLLMGTAYHSTTCLSFEWLLRSMANDPLPESIKVVVIGAGTDKAFSSLKLSANVELKGWVSNEELASLMVRAVAMLVPQRFGFGALTRLPELSCAAMPAIVSDYPCFALDLPPGAVAVKDNWPSWREAMLHMSESGASVPIEQYIAWEQAQDKSFRDYLSEFK